MIINTYFFYNKIPKPIIAFLVAFNVTSCSLNSPVREAVISPVRLNQLSIYKTESEISRVKYIDALDQVLIITEKGGIFLDVKSGEPISQFSHGGEINNIETDGSGNLLMISSRDRVRIINVKDNDTVLDKMDKGSSGDQISAFAPNGKSVYAFSKIWKLGNPTEVSNVFYPAALMSSEISRDNRYLLNAGLYGDFGLVDMKTGDYIHRWDTGNYIVGGSFSLDSKKFYIVNGARSLLSITNKLNKISVYDLSTYELLHKWSVDGSVSTFVISATTGSVFAGTETGDIYMWSAKTSESLGRWKGNSWVSSSISDESGRIWFGCENGAIKLYDPNVKGLSVIANVKAPISKMGLSKKGDVLVVVTVSGQKREVVMYNVLGLQ